MPQPKILRLILEKNARLGMMYRTWDRLDRMEKKEILKQAADCHHDLNRL